MKQAMFAYVNQARIRSWNQPVLSNESQVSLTRLQLTSVKHPMTKSQTRFA